MISKNQYYSSIRFVTKVRSGNFDEEHAFQMTR